MHELAFQVINGWVSRQYGRKVPSKILHVSSKFRAEGRLTISIHAIADTASAQLPISEAARSGNANQVT